MSLGGVRIGLERSTAVEFENYILEVRDLKFWAKNNEKRIFLTGLKLSRKFDFWGLFSPKKSTYGPKMPFFDRNQGWQKIFKIAQKSEFLIFFDESKCVWKLRFHSWRSTKKKMEKSDEKIFRPILRKNVTKKQNSAEI